MSKERFIKAVDKTACPLWLNISEIVEIRVMEGKEDGDILYFITKSGEKYVFAGDLEDVPYNAILEL